MIWGVITVGVAGPIEYNIESYWRRLPLHLSTTGFLCCLSSSLPPFFLPILAFIFHQELPIVISKQDNRLNHSCEATFFPSLWLLILTGSNCLDFTGRRSGSWCYFKG
jgi:hypothetical protein